MSDYLWVEKYRPQTIEECILPSNMKDTFSQFISQGEIPNMLFSGPPGIGKTKYIEMVCQEFAYDFLKIDSTCCNHSKDFIDRLTKAHQWKDITQLFQENPKPRIILIDELETLIKIDRNIPSHLIKFWNQHKIHIPCIIIGQYQAEKKIGELKKLCQMIHFSRIQEKDLFIYLKDRVPKGKIKLTHLMKIAEAANGSIYSAIQSVLEYEKQHSKKKKKTPIINHGQDNLLKIENIFGYLKRDNIYQVLHEDLWIHPLKVLENSSKIYTPEQYATFIPNYLFFEEWMHTRDNQEDLPAGYLTELIYQNNKLLSKNRKKIIDSIEMDFTKLLSYIS
ncbi:MAG: AAA family ATPase, partial [Candidatus Fonsibacter ubiquis]